MSKNVNNFQAIIVLGMHRSGTSALTGTLSRCGVFLGKTFEAAYDNPKGNQESPRIMTLHDDLLKRNGGSWDSPKHPAHWDAVHRELRDAIIEGHSHEQLWGFKDPRTLFTLQGWLRAIPNASLIGIFRHPFLVASSLVTRNNFTIEAGLELWTIYNRVLLWFLDNLPQFDLLEFSNDENAFSRQMQMLLERMSLIDPVENFFEPELRNTKIPEFSTIKGAIAALVLYEKLRSHKNHSPFRNAARAPQQD